MFVKSLGKNANSDRITLVLQHGLWSDGYEKRYSSLPFYATHPVVNITVMLSTLTGGIGYRMLKSE